MTRPAIRGKPVAMTRWFLLPLVALVAPASAVPQAATPVAAAAPRPALIVPTVVARYPHDSAAFTEGLIWNGGQLVESVGLEGQSDVRRVDLATGKVTARATIPAAQFGEGLAAWKGQLVSLTWHDGIAHRWSATSLKRLGTLRYSGEGWGLASDATGLVRSDGSATLTFHDPATLAVRRTLTVSFAGRPLTQLNELEVVDGAILANVWHQPFIVRIDPASGRVTGVIDLRAIVAEVGATDPEAVANGIAWDAAKRRLFVTGKRWPTVFEIRLPR
ncbi:glutaminyl-peptide cyclotransferase [Sphingomonas ginsenosidimutans]|jgi:glutamine cyclotransferase|nr:glutaminyl-peptide cyclotransferase [Sphingomonas ginsenosidimutans]